MSELFTVEMYMAIGFIIVSIYLMHYTIKD